MAVANVFEVALGLADTDYLCAAVELAALAIQSWGEEALATTSACLDPC